MKPSTRPVLPASGAAAPPSEASALLGPHLELRHLSKRFGSVVALENASFTVARGEFLTLVGPSGCGKTTLLRLIAGLEQPSTGRILMGGRDITPLPPAKRDYGIVFQSYALFPNLTVAENIAYGLRGPAWPKARRQERVSELLTLMGLRDQREKYPAQLSGGQQQRVALARALAAEPGLLLLDEPLSALDASVRHYLRQEIRALQLRLGITTLMVTHDQEEAMAVSDRLVVMRTGRIEQIGTPAAIYSQPATAFVAGFIGHTARFEAVADAPPGRIIADGLVFCADAARPFRFGTRLVCFIRPENVRLYPLYAASPGAFRVRLIAIEFLGATCRLALEAGRLRLVAAVRPAELGALSAEPGVDLLAVLPPEHLFVFAADDEHRAYL